MVLEYKRKANWGVGISILLSILNGLLSMKLGKSYDDMIAPSLLTLIIVISYFYGLYSYAKAKGYSGWLAAFGLLHLLGLVILVILPDHRKQG